MCGISDGVPKRMSQDRIFLLDTQQDSNNEVRTYDTLVDSRPSIQNNDSNDNDLAKKLPQYVAAICATISALAAGTVLGWTSPILSQIQHGKYHNISVNDSQMGWIGSLVTIGAMLTCIPAGFFCNIIGSKFTLLFLIVPYSIGWSLLIWADSISMLYVGRLMLGVAVGACCVAAPIYTSEIAQKEIRGALGSYFQLMVTCGIFFAYIIGAFMTPTHYTIVCACIPVLFFITFIFQPESPVYYIKKGKFEEARKSLVRLRGSEYDVDNELNLYEVSLKESIQSTVSYIRILKRKATLKALLISFCLMFFQQFSGINAVILYTSDIFKDTRVTLNPKIAAIIVGAVQAIATFVSSLIIDKLGRRPLLIFSGFTMASCSITLGFYFSAKIRHVIDWRTLQMFGFLPVVVLCIFVIVFSLGLGPIPWMISSEIFTPEIKSMAGSSAGTFNWFLAFVITKFYLEFKSTVGEDTTFYLFAVISCLGTLFVYFILPETKGKTIDEIQRDLEE